MMIIIIITYEQQKYLFIVIFFPWKITLIKIVVFRKKQDSDWYSWQEEKKIV